LLRVSETADWLEWSDWAAPFLSEPLGVTNGVANVPDAPGNGLDWDQAALKKYAM
jgi:mandelate racemase